MDEHEHAFRFLALLKSSKKWDTTVCDLDDEMCFKVYRSKWSQHTSSTGHNNYACSGPPPPQSYSIHPSTHQRLFCSTFSSHPWYVSPVVLIHLPLTCSCLFSSTTTLIFDSSPCVFHTNSTTFCNSLPF